MTALGLIRYIIQTDMLFTLAVMSGALSSIYACSDRCGHHQKDGYAPVCSRRYRFSAHKKPK